MKYIFSISFLLLSLVSFAQDIVFKDFDWPKSTDENLEIAEIKDDVIHLSQKRYLDFMMEEEGFFQYELIYNKVWITSDLGHEQFNKVYLPAGAGAQVLIEKARVINGADMMELTEEDVQEAVDESINQTYKYFALEGVKKGSVVEYYWIIKSPARYDVFPMDVQEDDPIKDYSFRLYAPDYFDFAFKSYNGLPDVERDTTFEGKNAWKLDLQDIPAFEEEEQATNRLNRQSFVFKLDKNTVMGKNDIVNYKEVTKAIYHNTYVLEDKSAEKYIAKLKKMLPAEIETADKLGKVKIIEHYLKSNIGFVDAYQAPQLSHIPTIVEQKVANQQGISRIYAALFKEYDIDSELVLTCNRFTRRFDPEFDVYFTLDDYLFYLPELEGYLAPYGYTMRFPYIPAVFTNQYGLFIQPVEAAGFETAISKVKKIELLDSDLTKRMLAVHVVIDDEVGDSKAQIVNKISGYNAEGLALYHEQSNDEGKKQVEYSLAEYFVGNEHITKLDVTNITMADFAEKPIVIDMEFEMAPFLEKAGNEYILKIGDLIGPQMEMYNDTKQDRKYPIDQDYAREYHRKILVDIPQAYTLDGLDELKMDHTYQFEGEDSFGFVSSYKWVTDTQLEVSVYEYYHHTTYPVSLFEEYKEVINAAADFNKVSILLAKK